MQSVARGVHVVSARAWAVLHALPREVLDREADGKWDTTILSIRQAKEERLVEQAEQIGKKVFCWPGYTLWTEDPIRLRGSHIQFYFYFVDETEEGLINRLTSVQIVSDVMST